MGRKIKTPISANAIAEALGLQPLARDCEIVRVDSAGEAGEGSLCFAKSAQWAARVSPGSVVIVGPEDAPSVTAQALVSPTPRLDFARALSFVESRAGFVWNEAAPQVHPTAKIGQNVVLGKGVVIGEGVVIHHNVVIGDEVIVGAGSVIKSCAVIGEEGFGFERDGAGEAVRLPHLGGVVIEESVEVGSLTTVCRGTLGDTRIRRGAKIDDHVHIAHNVDVGEHAFVIACAEVSGGVKIGAQAWIAPNASVLNQLEIGERALVGLGAVVVRKVEADSIVAGNPAKFVRARSA